MSRLILSALLLALIPCGMAWSATSFSVDPAADAITTVPTTESDILLPGPVVAVPDVLLGLVPFDNLNALSTGRENINRHVAFSVDRLSIGAPFSAVETEALTADAQGDVFTSVVGSGTNFLAIDESALGLSAGGFSDDDLDALNLSGGPVPFFSIDDFSTQIGAVFGPNIVDAADIFVGSIGALFADATDLGLMPGFAGDDIDALILDDRGTPGVLDPGIDRALFSLSTDSFGTFTGGGGPFSPADILFTDFTGAPPTLFASAASIGLDPFDDLNALSNPEPGSLALLACGLGGFALYRRRQKKQQTA